MENVVENMGRYLTSHLDNFAKEHSGIFKVQETKYLDVIAEIMEIDELNQVGRISAQKLLTEQCNPKTPQEAYRAYLEGILGESDMNKLYTQYKTLGSSLQGLKCFEAIQSFMQAFEAGEEVRENMSKAMEQQPLAHDQNIKSAIREMFPKSENFKNYLTDAIDMMYTMSTVSTSLNEELGSMKEGLIIASTILNEVLMDGWRQIGFNFANFMLDPVYDLKFRPAKIEHDPVKTLSQTAEQYNNSIAVLGKRLVDSYTTYVKERGPQVCTLTKL